MFLTDGIDDTAEEELFVVTGQYSRERSLDGKKGWTLEKAAFWIMYRMRELGWGGKGGRNSKEYKPVTTPVDPALLRS